jgi:hypothetical protein
VAANLIFGNAGDGFGARGSAIPGLKGEILHPMDVDLSTGTPDPGHPGSCWVECAKNNRRSFDSLRPLDGLRSLKMTNQEMGCVVPVRLCRVLYFQKNRSGFPGLTLWATFCPPYGRGAELDRGRGAAFSSQLSAISSSRVGCGLDLWRDGRARCIPTSQKRDVGHPGSCWVE